MINFSEHEIWALQNRIDGLKYGGLDVPHHLVSSLRKMRYFNQRALKAANFLNAAHDNGFVIDLSPLAH